MIHLFIAPVPRLLFPLAPTYTYTRGTGFSPTVQTMDKEVRQARAGKPLSSGEGWYAAAGAASSRWQLKVTEDFERSSKPKATRK